MTKSTVSEHDEGESEMKKNLAKFVFVRVIDFRQFRNSSSQFPIFFLKILEPKSACLRLLPFEGALTIDAKAFSMSPFRLLLTNDQKKK